MKLCSAWLLVLVAVAAACAPTTSDRGARTAPVDRELESVDLGDQRRVMRAASVLREWDRRRSRAWSGGDTAALAALYTRGSRAGRHDHAMLTAYVERGLRVTGLRTQVLAISLRSHAPGRVSVEVTDRVVGAHAVRRGVRVALPRDRPSTRVVSLRRAAGEWRVVDVRPARPPARQ